MEGGFGMKVEGFDARVVPFIQRNYPFHEWEPFKRFRHIWHWRNAFSEFSYVFLWGLVVGAILIIVAASLLFSYFGLQIVR